MTSPTRADTLTATLKTQEYFSDFLDSFALTPVGNDLGRATNAKSVSQSLKNLVLTNLGSRLFQPTIGCGIKTSLFEFDDAISIANMQTAITNTIKFNEPRANLINLNITGTPDQNSLQVVITYSLINNPEPIVLSFILKKIR